MKLKEGKVLFLGQGNSGNSQGRTKIVDTQGKAWEGVGEEGERASDRIERVGNLRNWKKKGSSRPKRFSASFQPLHPHQCTEQKYSQMIPVVQLKSIMKLL